ncbi:carotenoid oxygenase family protein [Streptomyces olivaceus]
MSSRSRPPSPRLLRLRAGFGAGGGCAADSEFSIPLAYTASLHREVYGGTGGRGVLGTPPKGSQPSCFRPPATADSAPSGTRTDERESRRWPSTLDGAFFSVPRDPADPRAAEDDGYTVAYVHDPDRGASDLVILAAQDFTGEPVARIHLPGRVPLGFHGSWIPDA